MKKRQAFQIRIANQSDQENIRALIRRVRLNPLKLHWPNFLVATDPFDQFIGCGQIKEHRDSTKELASLAVVEDWRGRGVGSAIIRTLIEIVDEELWLICRSDLESFYAQFGFEDVREGSELSRAYRRIRSASRIFSRFFPSMENYRIMLLNRVTTKTTAA